MNKSTRERLKKEGKKFKKVRLVYVDKYGRSLATNSIRYHRRRYWERDSK